MRKETKMKKKYVLILALLVITTMLFVPVNAKVTDPPPEGPVSDVVTLLTDILRALGVLQGDVTTIKNDVADIKTDLGNGQTTGYIMYSTPRFSVGSTDKIRVYLDAPGITDDVDVEVRTWSLNNNNPSETYSDYKECNNGLITLTAADQMQNCEFVNGAPFLSRIIQIIVQEGDAYKITPKVSAHQSTGELIWAYAPADFKVDHF